MARTNFFTDFSSVNNPTGKRTRVMSIFGTRPEAIKMAPVVMELKRRPDVFESLICVTAQHRQMLDGVLHLFNIQPDYDLDIMREKQTLEQVTIDVLTGMRRVLNEAKPDIVLVHGDTTTAFAASLAAFYQQIRVGHVEAGLRTRNPRNPFPEEMNRRLVGRLADLHFAPTQTAANALRAEGICETHILLTGNTIVDALKYISANASFNFDFDIPTHKRTIVVTAHRRENHGEPMLNICHAMQGIAETYPDVEIIFSVHPNPRVTETVYRTLKDVAGVRLVQPMEYDVFVKLMSQAYLIVTDSGGIQEEAPTLGVPVLVLRNETERPEAVQAGVVKLVGTETENIIEEMKHVLDSNRAHEHMAVANQLYGDGYAARRICAALAALACEHDSSLVPGAITDAAMPSLSMNDTVPAMS